MGVDPLAGASLTESRLHAFDGREAGFGFRRPAAAGVFLKEAAALRRFRHGGQDEVIIRIRQYRLRLTFVGQGLF